MKDKKNEADSFSNDNITKNQIKEENNENEFFVPNQNFEFNDREKDHEIHNNNSKEERERSFIDELFNRVPKEKEIENTLDDLIKSTNFGLFQLKLLLILFLFAFAEGYSMLVNSLAIPVLSKKWNISNFEKGFMGGSIFLGFMIGSLIVGQISDHMGRKISFSIGSGIAFLGSLGGLSILSVSGYIITNILVGIGIGIIVPSAISLVSETSNSSVRAIIMGSMWVMFPVGEIIGCLIAKSNETYDYKTNNWLSLHFYRAVSVSFEYLYF